MDQKEIQALVLVVTVVILVLAISLVLFFSYFQKKKTAYLLKQRETQQRFDEEINKSKLEILARQLMRREPLRNQQSSSGMPETHALYIQIVKTPPMPQPERVLSSLERLASLNTIIKRPMPSTIWALRPNQ